MPIPLPTPNPPVGHPCAPKRQKRLRRAYRLAGGLLVVLTACAPQPDGTVKPYTHADGVTAVDQAFARFGPTIVECAHGVATRESGHWPYAGLWPRRNKTHHGIFQLHDGFYGSVQAAAANLGRPASFFDPYENALAAAAGFESAGGSFRSHWPSTTPGGCP